MTDCPDCGTEMDGSTTGAPGSLWCPSCELEYWKEGKRWFRCGLDGTARHFITETSQDGGSDE